MAEVTLTKFVDFICKAGTPKLTAVRQWKNRPAYSPAQDFYKQFRDRIEEINKTGMPISALGSLVGTLQDKKKKSNYSALVIQFCMIVTVQYT